MSADLQKIFPACAKLLPSGFWQEHAARAEPGDLPELIATHGSSSRDPGYLADLARAELARYRLRSTPDSSAPADLDGYRINPGLSAVNVSWHPLLPLLDGKTATPAPESKVLLFWKDPQTGRNREAVATAADLLALKIVTEGLDPLAVARETGRPVGLIDATLDRAVACGLLLAPPSGLQRPAAGFPAPQPVPDCYRVAEVFTLQWHITHRCDLHCRHCYDRSRRDDVPLEQGLDILDQLRDFCRRQRVHGQVSFSGGNPFLHPDFLSLYQAARDRNLTPAILGNPVSAARLDQVLRIERPVFYQVSLEGLPEHNDLIRGTGNFAAVLDFLDLLKQKHVYSMVMLTLTRANLDQVLPLAERLRGRVDLFTFNRLAMVGEGTKLETPGPEEYRAFVGEYLKAREGNPVMALKDSLINISLAQDGRELFGGCTGFGCGAAFNFVSLLPDGEVHACRKFPSPIGDINRQPLEEIYRSAAAGAYRRGCRECAGCRVRAVCGGCLAVAFGCGLDPLARKDPACFIEA